MAVKKSEAQVDWMEYKTVRQYQSMGDMLDEFKVYGFKGGVETMIRNKNSAKKENGYGWLTRMPQADSGENP